MEDAFISRFVEQINIPTVSESENSGEKVDTVGFENDSEKAEIEIGPSLSKYSEVRGQPYTVEYLDIEYWDALTPELDPDGIVQSVDKIEKYVASEIVNRGFEDTTSSYRSIMDEVKQAVNVNVNEKAEHKIDRMNKYINLKVRLDEAERKKIKLVKELEALHG